MIGRQVIIKKEAVGLIPKGKLMSEREWRSLGIQMSLGWEHYLEYKYYFVEHINSRPESNVLLFRRRFGTDGTTGLVNVEKANLLKRQFRKEYGLED